MHKISFVSMLTLLFIGSFALHAFAHPGSTDDYGGHFDWSTGEYHYHHGFEAHYHTNGVCPYDFEDLADHSYHGSSYSSSNSYSYNYEDRDQYVPAVQHTLKPASTPTPKPSLSANVNSYAAPHQQFNPFATAAVIAVVILFVHLFDKQEKAEKKYQKSLLAKKQFEAEKAKYTQLYGGKDILKFVNAPPDSFIDSSGMPHQKIKNDDIFVVYLSSKQPRAFHKNKSCGKNLHKDNYINLRQYSRTITPCKKCNPPIPDTAWYCEYLEIKKIKEKYNID